MTSGSEAPVRPIPKGGSKWEAPRMRWWVRKRVDSFVFHCYWANAEEDLAEDDFESFHDGSCDGCCYEEFRTALYGRQEE
jgi:hypothetical protein